MDVEDEVLGELEGLERQIAKKDAALERAFVALVASGLSEAQARSVVLE